MSAAPLPYSSRRPCDDFRSLFSPRSSALNPSGIAMSSRRSSMSLATEPRSRPLTFVVTSILRVALTREIEFGDSAMRTSAT